MKRHKGESYPRETKVPKEDQHSREGRHAEQGCTAGTWKDRAPWHKLEPERETAKLKTQEWTRVIKERRGVGTVLAAEESWGTGLEWKARFRNGSWGGRGKKTYGKSVEKEMLTLWRIWKVCFPELQEENVILCQSSQQISLVPHP